MVGLSMSELSTRDQMTQKLTSTDRLTAFSNEQSPYHMAIKGPKNVKYKTIKTAQLTAKFMYKIMNEKQIRYKSIGIFGTFFGGIFVFERGNKNLHCSPSL